MDAQATPRRAITWCEHPAPDPLWKTHDVVLVVAQSEHEYNYTMRRGRGADAKRLSEPVIGLLLESIVSHFRRASGLPPAVGERLPSGDDRYTPAALRTMIDFTLRGDGSLEGTRIAERSDSVLAADVEHAIRASGEAGELLIDGDTSSRFDFDIWVATSPSGRAWWRAFTIDAPVARPVLVKRQRPRIRYPDALLGWEATFVMQFVVRWDGKAARETIRTVPAIDAYSWPSTHQREVFEAFIERVRYHISLWDYYPAEVAGCRVDQETQQKFNFSRAP